MEQDANNRGKIMKDRPLNDVPGVTLQGHLKFIYENAMDNDIKVVDDEPTADTLRPKDAPLIYDSKMYLNVGGTIYKITVAT